MTEKPKLTIKELITIHNSFLAIGLKPDSDDPWYVSPLSWVVRTAYSGRKGINRIFGNDNDGIKSINIDDFRKYSAETEKMVEGMLMKLPQPRKQSDEERIELVGQLVSWNVNAIKLFCENSGKKHFGLKDIQRHCDKYFKQPKNGFNSFVDRLIEVETEDYVSFYFKKPTESYLSDFRKMSAIKMEREVRDVLTYSFYEIVGYPMKPLSSGIGRPD